MALNCLSSSSIDAFGMAATSSMLPFFLLRFPFPGSFGGFGVLHVLPLGGPSAGGVEEDEGFKPRDPSRFAFGMGVGPLPSGKETVHLFIHALAMLEPVFSFDRRWELELGVSDGVRVLFSDTAIALYCFAWVVPKSRFVDDGRFLPLFLFGGGDCDDELVDSSHELLVVAVPTGRPVR